MMLNQILAWRFLIRGPLYAVLTVVISGRFQLRKLELLVYIFSYYLWKNIIYIFSSYLTDTFAFKLNLSILIWVFPAYNYWIPFILKMPRFLKCRRLQICRFHSFTLLKATKHKYLNNTKSEFKLFEVLVQPKKLQRLKQPARNCRN